MRHFKNIYMRTATAFCLACILAVMCNTVKAQIRFSYTAATAAMNSGVHTTTVASTSSYYSAYSNPYINTNIHDVLLPAYTTSVQVDYGIPGVVLWDWISVHNAALSILSYGPGSGNDINYLNSDIPALNNLAYGSYLNPSAYGSRTLQINVQQWNGNLNWYSDYAGGGQFVRNWLTWAMPIQGKLTMQIK